jgi:signal transduction histidine kinase
VDSGHVDPAALVYHELRAPLGLVATAARSMAHDAPDEDLRLRCEVIVRAAERMLRTAETVSSLGANTHERSGTFRPVAIVTDLVRVLSGLGVRLELSVDAAASTWLCGHGERFEALVHSLIANAIDHGSPREPIQVAVSGNSDLLTVQVVNAVASEDRHEGSGLGTIIARALARGLDARLESFTRDGHYTAQITIRRRFKRRSPSQPAGFSPESA